MGGPAAAVACRMAAGAPDGVRRVPKRTGGKCRRQGRVPGTVLQRTGSIVFGCTPRPTWRGQQAHLFLLLLEVAAVDARKRGRERVRGAGARHGPGGRQVPGRRAGHGGLGSPYFGMLCASSTAWLRVPLATQTPG